MFRYITPPHWTLILLEDELFQFCMLIIEYWNKDHRTPVSHVNLYFLGKGYCSLCDFFGWIGIKLALPRRLRLWFTFFVSGCALGYAWKSEGLDVVYMFKLGSADVYEIIGIIGKY